MRYFGLVVLVLFLIADVTITLPFFMITSLNCRVSHIIGLKVFLVDGVAQILVLSWSTYY